MTCDKEHVLLHNLVISLALEVVVREASGIFVQFICMLLFLLPEAWSVL